MSSLNGGVVAGIVLSVLVLVPLLGFGVWYAIRTYRKHTHRVRSYQGTVDLVKERYNPGHRPTPSQSSGRLPLLESIERPQTPESIRSVASNVSSWLHGQRSYQPSKPTSLSYSYHEVGDEEEAIARLRSGIIDISHHHPHPRPAPVPLNDRRLPQRPPAPLETIYSASTDESRFLDKFPDPPRGIGNKLKNLGNRLSRSFTGLPSPPPENPREWRPSHKHSVSVDEGASLRSNRIRGVAIPPRPALPPPTVPPNIPLPKIPRAPSRSRRREAKVVPLSPVPDVSILSPPTSSNSSGSNYGTPFDVDIYGEIVLDSVATRPLRPLRPGQTHSKSASVY